MDLLHNEKQGGYKPMKIEDGYHKHDSMCAPRRAYNIYIIREQIMYDIEAQLMIIARSRRNGNGVQDNLFLRTENIKPMLNRWVDKYVALAEARMQAYILKEHSAATTDGIYDGNEIHFHLAMPFSWDETVFMQLKQTLHDYLVSGVMYEYLALTLTTKDSVTLAQREQNEIQYQDIKRLVCATKGRVRKAMHPFP